MAAKYLLLFLYTNEYQMILSKMCSFTNQNILGSSSNEKFSSDFSSEREIILFNDFVRQFIFQNESFQFYQIYRCTFIIF